MLRSRAPRVFKLPGPCDSYADPMRFYVFLCTFYAISIRFLCTFYIGFCLITCRFPREYGGIAPQKKLRAKNASQEGKTEIWLTRKCPPLSRTARRNKGRSIARCIACCSWPAPHWCTNRPQEMFLTASYVHPKSVLSPSYVRPMSVLSCKAGENGRKTGQILDVQHAKKKTWSKTT